MRDRAFNYKRVAMLAAVLVVVGMTYTGWWVALMAIPIFYLVHRSHNLHLAKLGYEQQHAQEVDQLHLRTIEALAVAIDTKDHITHQHLQRISVYAEAIGREMALPDSELRALRAAALLHDVGKLAVPEYIISKPGRLTEEEFEKVKTHTLVGSEILERVLFPYPVAPIVRSHHERWNGTGYPDGLKGEEIPTGARILAVVDSFDAMASDRPYRRARTPEEAVAAIKKEAGVSYDPRVVEILERIYPRLVILAKSFPQPESRLSTNIKIEKGQAPRAGLAVEKVSDTSSALYSIAQARQELQMLYDLTQALGSSLNVEETLQVLACELQKLIRFDAIAVYLLGEGKLIPRYVGGVNSSLLARLPIPVGEGLSGWVAGNDKYSLNGNPAVEPGYVQDPHQFSKLRSALSVPLDSSKGVIGALTLYRTKQDAFTIDHLRILKAIGMKAGSAIHNALIHEAISRSGQVDLLTGLPNAEALSKRLEQETARAIRQRTTYSIFLIVLNGLKQIPDKPGDLTRDQVLKAVGTALGACLREYDYLARREADEFFLLLPGMNAEDAAAKRIELVLALEGLSRNFPQLAISASMGSASYPEDGQTIEHLMAIANRRLHRHKRPCYDFRTMNLVITTEGARGASES